jgi:hypothetical protein
MNISRSTITALSVLASSPYFVRGFSTKRIVASAFPKVSFSKKSHIVNVNINNNNNISTSTALPMIFDKLFSSLSGGGGFASKIDYSTLSYPAPKIAAAASEGKVPTEMNAINGKDYKLATFAGGCFWGLELAFQRVPGVEYTAVGYTQGPETDPNYDAVCAG